MRTVMVTSELPAPADVVWRGVRTPDAFEHVAAPLVRFPAAGAVGRPWSSGDVVIGWTWLFGVVPFSRHRLEVVSLEDDERCLTSSERGGVIRTWNHVIRVTPIAGDPDRCQYLDRIDIEAGVLTGAVAAYAHLFYRHRQRRWRRLARLLRHYESVRIESHSP